MRYLLLLLLLCKTSMLWAQYYPKAEKALEAGKFEKALQIAEKGKKNNEKPAALYYLIKSKALYNLSKDPKFLEKNSSALESAGKQALIAIQRDPNQEITGGEGAYFSELALALREKAGMHMEKRRNARAGQIYRMLVTLEKRPQDKLMVGKLILADGDTSTGMQELRALGEEIYTSYSKEQSAPEGCDEAFCIIVRYRLRKDQPDSALAQVRMVRELYGKSPYADSAHYAYIVYQVSHTIPGELLKQQLEEAVQWFPTDSLLIRKENALFFYLVNEAFAGYGTRYTDTLLSQWVSYKTSKSHTYPEARKWDPFLYATADSCIEELMRYCFLTNRVPLAKYLGSRTVQYRAGSTDINRIKSTWISYLRNTNNISQLDALCEAAIQYHGQAAYFKAERKKLLLEKAKLPPSFQSANLYYALGKLVQDEPTNKTLKELRSQLALQAIPFFIDTHAFSAANYLLRQEMPFATGPRLAQLEKLQEKLAREDFKYAYYQTAFPKTYAWNGSSIYCIPGRLSAEELQKLQSRFQYFRRTAGVNDALVFDTLKNKYCQYAALLTQANGRPNHEPSKNVKCFTTGGLKGCQASILAFNNHTSYALTSFLADEHNASCGNRRLMLNPFLGETGFGSTDNAAALWIADLNNQSDSLVYRTQYIAWPAAGAFPDKLIFKHWSFTLDADLSKAQVSMKAGNNPIKCTQLPLTAGYGLPTLVWIPEFADKNKLPETITVTISNVIRKGKKQPESISYKVKPFSPVF